MNAREQILGRLRAHRPAAPVSAPEVAAWYAAHRPVTPMAERVERLCVGLEQAHAEVHRVTPENWVDRLAEVLQARALTTLLVGRDTAHGARAAEALAARGVMCPGDGQAVEHWKERLCHEVPAALTAARAAIAETGTLVLWPDAREPRLMSLVPPVHVVLVDAARVYDTFYEAMGADGWAHGLPTNALLVSGPSKTADIQQTLAYGAHGPRELVVLVCAADTETEAEAEGAGA